jgi:DNA-binding NarL/FixJ family response regulator
VVPFRFARRDLVVVGLARDELDLLADLSPAERDVARGVLLGQSNAAIATARSTSPRTVAKQVASIFQKLGVGSRAELVGRISAAPGRAAPRRRRSP